MGKKLEPADVDKRGEFYVLKSKPEIRVDARSFKMSKSRGNVVNPDDVIRDYGADSLRLFEMFMGPLEQVKPWSTAGVEGVYRFLQRVWRNLIDVEESRPAPRIVDRDSDGKWRRGAELLSEEESKQAQVDYDAIVRPQHRLIRKLTDDIERLSFNTAVSSMMEFNNALAKLTFVPKEAALTLVRLMEPLAPHVAEELNHLLSAGAASRSLSGSPWPVFDPALCVDPTIELPVQINGKLAGRVPIASDASEEAVFAVVLADPQVLAKLAGRTPKKKIYVNGRMLNLVV